MREKLESIPNLFIKQAEVIDVVLDRSTAPLPTVTGLQLRDGRTVGARAVVVTTGTFLNGLIHCGEQQYTAGRSGEPASVLLGESLKSSACAEPASRPAPRRGSMAAPSTGRALKSSPATAIPRPSASAARLPRARPHGRRR